MKHICLSIALSLLSFGMMFGQQITQTEVNAQLQNLPFASYSITLPTFPDKTFNITEAGAVGDGLIKNTQAINSTIEKCSKAGGGKVLVPAGLWLTGPITMQSNVNLYLAEGAIVIFSADLNDYPIISDDGKYTIPDLINGSNLENVAITGKGVFNGNGQYWRMIKKGKMTNSQWNEYAKTGEITEDSDLCYPRKGTLAALNLLANKSKSEITKDEWETKVKPSLRPYMLAIKKSKNVLIEGVTLNNSPKFAMNISDINGLVLHQVNVQNEWWAQNGDGLDIGRSKNVLVYECTVNTGDDGICMKSAAGKKNEFSLENIVIKNCKVYHAHGGFVIGSNTDANMHNIYVTNCSFIGTDTGIRVKSNVGRGGKVTNIFCENIYMKDIENAAIVYELEYNDVGAVKTKDARIDTTKVPDFDGFSIKNVYCDGAKIGISIGGTEASHVKNVLFKDIIIKAKDGVKAKLSENITLDNVTIISDKNPTFSLNNVNGFTFKNIKNVATDGIFIKVTGKASKGIKVENSAIKAKQIELSDNLKPSILTH
ncbi:MAG: glycoside hydrolase family 28 protein [Paludibacteraceae bacterium]|nr:glycoside hydrolase family 28 protein [Paludibacteraceae bacterium]